MDQARDGAAVLAPDDEDVAAVALGDDLFLQILRGIAAAQVGLERPAQPLPLAPQLVAHAGQRRTGIVLDVAVLADGLAHAGVLVGEARGPARDGRQGRQAGGGALHEGGGAIHRVEEVGEREQAERLEGTAQQREPVERGADGLAGAQRQGLMILQQQDRLAGEVEGFGDAYRLGGRHEPIQRAPAERRHRVRAHHGRDLVELERAESRGVHGG